MKHSLGVRPRAIAVGIVALEADVLDADHVARADGGRIVDRGEPEVALQDLGRTQVAPEVGAIAGTVDDVLEPVDEHRYPADAALAHDDLEVRVLHGPARPQP